MPDQASPRTVRDLLSAAIQTLNAAGIDGARLDAQVLLADVLGVDRMALITDPDRVLSADESAAFDDFVRRRAAREPVSHILGRREFWSLPFKVTPATLAPRPDSETLVAAVLDYTRERGLGDKPIRILDLGTGTGCLILALLHELSRATGVGVDRSVAAVAVAEENAASLGLAGRFDVVVGDWTAPLAEAERFDIIISNPPYISDQEFAELDEDVARYEPAGALKGGTDGLDAYRALLPGAVRHLAPNGALFLEIGASQAQAVGDLCRTSGLGRVSTVPDLAGRDRVITAQTGEKVLPRAK